jgi:hypothetical protein
MVTSLETEAFSWALYLYLCGSNLESRQGWATKTLEELQDADIPENVTVVVQAGGSDRSVRYYKLLVYGT